MPPDAAPDPANVAAAEADSEWRDRLLKILHGPGVTQPNPDKSAGQGLYGCALTLGICGMLIMLLLGWRTWSSQVEHPKWDPNVPYWIQQQQRDLREADEAWNTFIITGITVSLFLVLMPSYNFMLQRARRMLAPDAFAELDRLPDRRPILFLRPFDRQQPDTGVKRVFVPVLGDPFEIAAVKALRRLGPVICIGKPGEKLKPVGAGRFYVSNELWQSVIIEVLKSSQFVLLIPGSGPGLLWEMERVVELVDPLKVIIGIPNEKGSKRRETWRTFRDFTEKLFAKSLPLNPGRALFLCFDKSWRPFLVKTSSHLFEQKRIRETLRGILKARSQVKELKHANPITS